MSSRRWILVTLLLTFLVGGAVVLINVRLDIYGIFRDPHGRALPIYDSERRAKYLLNLRYVPSNFEAVLLGSSVTGNWDTSGIQLFRTYNESVDGGNVTEEKVLAERAIQSPGIRAAICVIHPYMTNAHGLSTTEMTEREHWGALGSISLFRSYRTMAAVSSGQARLVWSASGAEDVEAPEKLNPVIQHIMRPGAEVEVDEQAFEDYRALVGSLRRRGVKLVVVVPPTAETLLGPKREAMSRFAARLSSLFQPEDVLIDFNAPEYASFRGDAQNYRDGVHLSRRGAAEVVKLLDQRLTSEKSRLRP